jgi:uncharacterized protein
VRVVLDTNVWLDWLVFDDPGIAPIRKAVERGRVELYVDSACEEELARVLARGFAKRALNHKEQATCIAQCRRIAQRVEASLTEAERNGLPACRDADDQKLLEAALAAGAAFLVTKDRELLRLAKKGMPFQVVTPGEFCKVLKIHRQ